MNWGYKITIAAALFMGYIIFLVIKCFQQDVSLVDQHYYKEEIEYEAQIQKIKNANETKDLTIKYAPLSNELVLKFNNETNENLTGKIQLFRPSNDKMDKILTLSLNDEGQQFIPSSQLAKGLWKVKVSWSDGKESYYKEEVLVL